MGRDKEPKLPLGKVSDDNSEHGQVSGDEVPIRNIGAPRDTSGVYVGSHSLGPDRQSPVGASVGREGVPDQGSSGHRTGDRNPIGDVPAGSLLIVGQTVKVVISHQLRDAFGEFVDHPEPVIRLGSVRGRTLTLTLIHEIREVLDTLYGLGLRESRIRTLEQGIAAFVRDNPATANAILKSLSSDH